MRKNKFPRLDDMGFPFALDLATSIAEQVEFQHTEEDEQIHLFVPFYFDDGDGFSVFLERSGDDIVYTDKGNTMFHMSFDNNVEEIMESERFNGNVDRIISMYDMEKREHNEIVLVVKDPDRYGELFFNFMYVLLRISLLANRWDINNEKRKTCVASSS